MIFGILDMLSLVLLSQQEYAIISNLNEVPHQTLSYIRVALLLISYPLLFISALGFFRSKKFGFIVYYVLFPLRLLVWIFSFGFITLLMDYTENQVVADWLFRIPIILEFFRLYFTIKIHREYFN